MKNPARISLFAAALVLVAAGCSSRTGESAGSSRASASAGEPADDTVVARIGEETITLGEVDAKIQSQLEKLDKDRYQLRRQQIEAMINERLVKEAAAKEGLSEDEYFEREVLAKAGKPSDADLRQFYEQNKERMPPGVTFEQMKPQLEQYLAQGPVQQRARELFQSLQEGANVSVTFDPPEAKRREVSTDGPSRGPEDAPVTIVEFSDFECPYCQRASETLDEVFEKNAGKVRVVFKQFPLAMHSNARKAAEASLCAEDQGQFWRYHDLLFANQRALGEEKLKEYAQQVGLEQAEFNECLDSGKYAQQVEEDFQEGQNLGVEATPTFFINGVPLSGAVPATELQAVIDRELGAEG